LTTNALKLLCCIETECQETVELFVEGVPIGKALVSGHFFPDQTIDIPIDKFPLVSLPTTIRLKAENGIFDSDAELNVETVDQVFVAVGKGEVYLDSYVIEPGSILINVSNINNGFWSPNIYVRFDTGVTRTANVESVRRREEGGCQARLRVPLHINDFHQPGLSLEILSMDRDGALGRIEYRSVDPQRQDGQVARVVADLRSIYAVQAMRIAAIEADFKRSLAAMEARLETFCEYILSITQDRLAAGDVRDLGRLADAGGFGFAAEAKQFLSEIAKESDELRKSAAQGPVLGVRLLPDAEAYFDGWNYPETGDDGRLFRWMKRVGSVNLPCSVESLFCIVVQIGKIFNNLPPTFFAKIDNVPADVQCFAMASGYELKITPLFPAGAAGAAGSFVLTLECASWGSPIDDQFGTDRRELSALIWSVEAFTNEAVA
jgi:hypothetical protein